MWIAAIMATSTQSPFSNNISVDINISNNISNNSNSNDTIKFLPYEQVKIF